MMLSLHVLTFECVVQFKHWTLTAWFTCLSWVTSTATKGGLEVVDGLLKNLSFPALKPNK